MTHNFRATLFSCMPWLYRSLFKVTNHYPESQKSNCSTIMIYRVDASLWQILLYIVIRQNNVWTANTQLKRDSRTHIILHAFTTHCSTCSKRQQYNNNYPEYQVRSKEIKSSLTPYMNCCLDSSLLTLYLWWFSLVCDVHMWQWTGLRQAALLHSVMHQTWS